MRNQPRILFGTLNSGENEFERCLESLRAQHYSNWELKVFEHLPKKLALDTLYRAFMDRSAEFDLFVKLDADMVFLHSDCLIEIIRLFEERSSVDHIEMLLQDWFTDSLTMGLHVFSNRAVWRFSDEGLFTDIPPSVPGVRWSLFDKPAPLVIHSPDPSPFQAFHFGVHRALKAVQPDRKSFEYERAVIQWANLGKVWAHFVRSKDRRLGLAILGADLVLRGRVDQSQMNYTNVELLRIFEQHSDLTSDELYRMLKRWWGSDLARELRHRMLIWPRCSPGIIRESASTFLRVQSRVLLRKFARLLPPWIRDTVRLWRRRLNAIS